MYAEFATDAKVQSLSEVMQRRYIMLLCLKCNDELPGLTDDEVACAMRISEDEALQTKEKLTAKGLIAETWEPTNWDKRQYVSDTSNERVKKYRDKLSNTNIDNTILDKDIYTDTDTEKKPLQKQNCNVTVTLQQEKPYDYFRDFWLEYPKFRRKEKPNALKIWNQLKVNNDDFMEKVMLALTRDIGSDDWKKGFVPYPAKWLKGKRWEDEL